MRIEGDAVRIILEALAEGLAAKDFGKMERDMESERKNRSFWKAGRKAEARTGRRRA